MDSGKNDGKEAQSFEFQVVDSAVERAGNKSNFSSADPGQGTLELENTSTSPSSKLPPPRSKSKSSSSPAAAKKKNKSSSLAFFAVKNSASKKKGSGMASSPEEDAREMQGQASEYGRHDRVPKVKADDEEEGDEEEEKTNSDLNFLDGSSNDEEEEGLENKQGSDAEKKKKPTKNLRLKNVKKDRRKNFEDSMFYRDEIKDDREDEERKPQLLRKKNEEEEEEEEEDDDEQEDDEEEEAQLYKKEEFVQLIADSTGPNSSGALRNYSSTAEAGAKNNSAGSVGETAVSAFGFSQEKSRKSNSRHGGASEKPKKERHGDDGDEEQTPGKDSPRGHQSHPEDPYFVEEVPITNFRSKKDRFFKKETLLKQLKLLCKFKVLYRIIKTVIVLSVLFVAIIFFALEPEADIENTYAVSSLSPLLLNLKQNAPKAFVQIGMSCPLPSTYVPQQQQQQQSAFSANRDILLADEAPAGDTPEWVVISRTVQIIAAYQQLNPDSNIWEQVQYKGVNQSAALIFEEYLTVPGNASHTADAKKSSSIAGSSDDPSSLSAHMIDPEIIATFQSPPGYDSLSFRILITSNSSSALPLDMHISQHEPLYAAKLVFSCLILVGIYIIIIFEIINRTLAALYGGLLGLGLLCLFGIRPSIEVIAQWIEFNTLILLFGMM